MVCVQLSEINCEIFMSSGESFIGVAQEHHGCVGQLFHRCVDMIPDKDAIVHVCANPAVSCLTVFEPGVIEKGQ